MAENAFAMSCPVQYRPFPQRIQGIGIGICYNIGSIESFFQSSSRSKICSLDSGSGSGSWVGVGS